MPTPQELCGYYPHPRTKRKQAEQEGELLLERDRFARPEAKAANLIKNEFLAVLSHKLRSPLGLNTE